MSLLTDLPYNEIKSPQNLKNAAIRLAKNIILNIKLYFQTVLLLLNQRKSIIGSIKRLLRSIYINMLISRAVYERKYTVRKALDLLFPLTRPTTPVTGCSDIIPLKAE